MEKQDFQSIVDTYSSMQEDRKDILDDLNEKLTNYSSCHNIEITQLRKAIKSYLTYEKDKEAYLESDAVVDNILNMVIDDPKWGQTE